MPLAPKAEADAYLAKNEEIDEKIADLKSAIEKIEHPYREKLQLELIRKKFPENVVRVVGKPESERTPGDTLLVAQVLQSRQRLERPGRSRDECGGQRAARRR